MDAEIERITGLMALATGDEKHALAAHSTLDVLWVLYDRVLPEHAPQRREHPSAPRAGSCHARGARRGRHRRRTDAVSHPGRGRGPGCRGSVLYDRDCTTVAPFDGETLQAHAAPGKVALVEPSYAGTLTAEIVAAVASIPVRVEAVGVPHVILSRCGIPEQHDEARGVTAASIRARIHTLPERWLACAGATLRPTAVLCSI